MEDAIGEGRYAAAAARGARARGGTSAAAERECGVACPSLNSGGRHKPPVGDSRHRPRHAGGAYATRALPEELQESAEAAEVWEAAKAASPRCPLVVVRGWKIEWRPRPGGGGKKGDLYLWQPTDGHRISGRPIRSLSALQDVLTLRQKAQRDGAPPWVPPLRGSIVKVRTGVADEAGATEGSGTAHPQAEAGTTALAEDATDVAAGAPASTFIDRATAEADMEEADEAKGEAAEAAAAEEATAAGAEDVAAEEVAEEDDAASDQWQRAEVRRVEPGLGGDFQVALLLPTGETDETSLRWCSAFDEGIEWQRLPGEPVYLPRKAGALGRAYTGRAAGGKRTRRCGECAGCMRDECGECSACMDKPKYGGPGRMKQACKHKVCAHPVMPMEFGDGAGEDENGAQRANGGVLFSQEEDDDVLVEQDEEVEEDEGAAFGGSSISASAADAAAQLEVEISRLRRQLCKAHAIASSYRDTAQEMSTAACYLFPIAHAAVAVAGGSLQPPRCFFTPLSPLPPLPPKVEAPRPRRR